MLGYKIVIARLRLRLFKRLTVHIARLSNFVIWLLFCITVSYNT